MGKEKSFRTELNEVLNNYLSNMMNAFRSSRNAWIDLEKKLEKNDILLHEAKTLDIKELLNRFLNPDQKQNYSGIYPDEILEKDKNSLSYDNTITKVNDLIIDLRSKGYNQFTIAGDYSVSIRGFDDNEPRKHYQIRLTQREFIFWNCFILSDTIKERIMHLLNQTLIYQISMFESCLKELIRNLYDYKPEFLKSNSKNLSNEEIIESKTKEEIIAKILEYEVDWWGYNPIDKIAKKLASKFNIHIKRDFDKWGEFREAIYFRNAIVHNSSLINYNLAKSLKYDASQIGNKIPITKEYIENSYPIIRDCLTFIRNGLHDLE